MQHLHPDPSKRSGARSTTVATITTLVFWLAVAVLAVVLVLQFAA